MKHWRNNHKDLITLEIASDNNPQNNRVLSISYYQDKINFCENCDNWFITTASKEEAIEALGEAIQWIKEH